MVEEKHIHVLSDVVANKIAAGEVVERPASVLKELIENSIDAGSTQLDVEVVAGGKKLIKVSDNGSGMNRDDALLSIERHATSKIKDVDDIEDVDTLGFRGEALAAISSVSRFELLTSRAGDMSGTEIQVSGGKIQDVQEVGAAPGTTISVRNLFFNVPARRKFLRTEQTELTHLRQLFVTYALANPATGFSLTVDGRKTQRLPAVDDLSERLRGLFDEKLTKSLREIKYAAGSVSVTGFTSVPQMHRADKSGQYIFINKRPATAPLLGYALRQAYDSVIPRQRHPVVFMFLEIDPSQLDVNVHPTKKEVRFRMPGEVRDVTIEALRRALAGPVRAPLPAARAGLPPPPPPVLPIARKPAVTIEDIPQTRTFQYPRMPLISAPESTPSTGEAEKKEELTPTGSPWEWCRVLGQVGGLYLILETEDGIVLMDPHAAHERVLFERFLNEVLNHKVATQGLLVPETVNLPPHDALCVRKNLELLKELGFGVSDFGGDSFIVDALPAFLSSLAAETVLLEVAKSVELNGPNAGKSNWSKESVAQAACKAAVKARDRLTLAEIERLVVDLAKAEMPYTCPHGRPTLIFMSFSELDKKFGRT